MNNKHTLLNIGLLLVCGGLILTISLLYKNGTDDSIAPQNLLVGADEAEEATAEWMKQLPDSLPLLGFALPGTHDSAATHGGKKLQTQGSDVAAQLQAGIRAFDIRLRERDGKLGLYHSDAFQECYWESEVLPAFLSFLKEHPSEALVVSLKKEGGEAADYQRLLSQSLNEEANRPYFLTEYSDTTTLGNCRGRILFLHRDEVMTLYPGVRCEGWADNASCLLTLRTAGGTETTLFLQDEYEYTTASEWPRKLEAIQQSLRWMDTPADGSYRSGISFISATALPVGFPIDFANSLNLPVTEWLRAEQLRPKGILFIDFVSHEGGKALVQQLIRSNF